MKKIVIGKIFYILILLLFINCDNEIIKDFPTAELKPYDPVKAGAEIVESHDLSSIYNYDPYIHLSISEFNENFYILSNEKIFVLNKNTLIQEKEIYIDIKNVFFDYNINYSVYYSNPNISIFNNKIFFSYYIVTDNKNYKIIFFDMDLSGDNLRTLDISSDLYFNNPPSISYGVNLGYNKIKDVVWIKVNRAELYEYKFNSNVYDKVNYLYIPYFDYNILFIDANTFWNKYTLDIESYIEKRNLTEPNTVISTIDISYLGTYASPYDLLVDGEFLWIIIWKDDKLQLLKLKPL